MNRTYQSPPLRKKCVAISLLIACLFSSAARAQQGSAPTIQIDDSTTTIVIHVGSHYQLEFGYRIPDLWVGNSIVMTAYPLSPSRIVISGSEPGLTTLTVSDEKQHLQAITVHVRNDARDLQSVIDEHFPGQLIQVHALKKGVVLRGEVASADAITQAVEIAEDYYPGLVLNQIQISGSHMIAINVRIYEVARTKLQQLGVDWSFFGENVTAVQSISGLIQQISTAGSGPTASGQTLSFGVLNDDLAFDAFIQALEQKNLAKLLDQPTLVAENGRAAEFLSGGEVPIQISTNFGGTSVEYKSFGTKLDIIPTIHGHGEMTLEVRAEVSDVAADLTVAGGSPGFRVRRVNTGVRMKAGQTLALAGDFREDSDTIVRGIPFLMDIPLLGPIFRNTKLQKTETELVFLITPRFIDAVEETCTRYPGESSQIPSHRELFYEGQMEVAPCQCDACSSTGFPPRSTYTPSSGRIHNPTVAEPYYVPNQADTNIPNQPDATESQKSPLIEAPPFPPMLVPPDDRNVNPGNPSDGTLSEPPRVDSNNRIQGSAPTPIVPVPNQGMDSNQTDIPGRFQNVQPEINPEPNANSDENWNLPNPFENRRSTEKPKPAPVITGAYGFSK